MTREDWGQHGTAMEGQSTAIRDWVGEAPYYFAVTDVKKFNRDHRDADVEAAEYIAPGKSERFVFDISDLARVGRDDKATDHTVVVLHPFGQHDLEAIRHAVEQGSVGKLFILTWSRHDMVQIWLDGLGALNLHTHESAPANDPLLLAAAKMIKDEDYNGLSSGRGKDAIVQLVHAFADEGYPVEPNLWLRAYFAVGGSSRHAESMETLIKEMRTGRKHRVTPRYLENIVEILRQQLVEDENATTV